MNSKERVIAALQRQVPDRVPTIEWSIDKKIIKELVGDANPFDAVQKLEIDGVMVKPDYTKEFINENTYIDEWGCKKQITSESVNHIIESPLKDINEYGKFKFPDPYSNHRFTTIEKAVQKLGSEKAIVLNVRDVWSDIRDILGYEAALISVLTDREKFSKLLDRCIDYNHTIAQIAKNKYGIDILVTTDDYADNNNVIFGPKLFHEFFAERFKRAIGGFKRLGYYCIKHCDGNIKDIIDIFIDAGVDCLDPIDPDGGMDLKIIKKKYGKKICLKGNISCTKTLVNGTTDDVENEVKSCLQSAAPKGGYIISSSNSIHSGVKAVNYLKMLEVIKKYGRYPLDFGQ